MACCWGELVTCRPFVAALGDGLGVLFTEVEGENWPLLVCSNSIESGRGDVSLPPLPLPFHGCAEPREANLGLGTDLVTDEDALSWSSSESMIMKVLLSDGLVELVDLGGSGLRLGLGVSSRRIGSVAVPRTMA